uniref:Uncharacterized protein n=1 Tax=Ixodes ricinus TaxID=34613 RepID=A0A6B0UIJ1_IXORI
MRSPSRDLRCFVWFAACVWRFVHDVYRWCLPPAAAAEILVAVPAVALRRRVDFRESGHNLCLSDYVDALGYCHPYHSPKEHHACHSWKEPRPYHWWREPHPSF